MSHVKPRRQYDSSGRQQQARRNRQAILDAAERLFLEHGYAATTVAAVAGDAGVSSELVYKAFGGKSGLVRALYDRQLAGTGSVPAYERSDRMRDQENDPRAIMHGWGLLTAEVASSLTPIRMLLRAAATSDGDLATVLEQIEEQRLQRMQHHAEFLVQRGHLRPDVTLAETTDILWVCSSVELYDLLVLQRRWTLDRFARFITDMMISGLLPQEKLAAAPHQEGAVRRGRSASDSSHGP